MENATDALKIVLGIVIFIIGLTLLFNMASQARETARILISETDRTKYYNYYEEANEQTIDKNGNRIVTIQDIIPILYRYSEENYGVTIVDKNGNIVARYDLDTETACNNWPIAKPYSKYRFITETNNIYRQVNSLASKINKKGINLIHIDTTPKNPSENQNVLINSEGMTALFEKIYAQETSQTIRRKYYCYWIGTLGWTSQRIDSDVSRN